MNPWLAACCVVAGTAGVCVLIWRAGRTIGRPTPEFEPTPIDREHERSPLVEPLQVAYDVLVCRRGELEGWADVCTERGDKMMAAVWLDQAVRVQHAAEIVADLRDRKAGVPS